MRLVDQCGPLPSDVFMTLSSTWYLGEGMTRPGPGLYPIVEERGETSGASNIKILTFSVCLVPSA